MGDGLSSAVDGLSWSAGFGSRACLGLLVVRLQRISPAAHQEPAVRDDASRSGHNRARDSDVVRGGSRCGLHSRAPALAHRSNGRIEGGLLIGDRNPISDSPSASMRCVCTISTSASPKRAGQRQVRHRTGEMRPARKNSTVIFLYQQPSLCHFLEISRLFADRAWHLLCSPSKRPPNTNR